MKTMLVTGSSGLIGSEVCRYFAPYGYQIIGVDNNYRRQFFGEEGDTTLSLKALQAELSTFQHCNLDIRDRQALIKLLQDARPDVIVHTAAQPSHDLAARLPFEDFETNAMGTLHLLEGARRHCPESPFIHMSTNKVYGDKPNHLDLTEGDLAYDFADPAYAGGIAEDFGIDQSLHSLFGASKVAADIYVQEYGRYFGMPTCCLRGGCLTGPNHSGVALHGFLSYLTKCILSGTPYTIYGYQGKQVRDNIHSLDVARFMEAFIQQPRCGEVYNIGGGKGNACSVRQAICKLEKLTGKSLSWSYESQARTGDHICYYSDLRKARSHYPQWDIQISLDAILEQIVAGWHSRLASSM